MRRIGKRTCGKRIWEWWVWAKGKGGADKWEDIDQHGKIESTEKAAARSLWRKRRSCVSVGQIPLTIKFINISHTTTSQISWKDDTTIGHGHSKSELARLIIKYCIWGVFLGPAERREQ
jgi:hypothetical protein